MKNFYTNTPLKEAIEIALQKLYSHDSSPEIQRATIKRLLNMLLSKVSFKCNDSCHTPVDGLARGASFACTPMAERLRVCSKTRNIIANWSITQIARYCESCCSAKNKEKYNAQMKLILRYKYDVIRTVNDDLICVLDAANSLHPNLQFTLQEISSEGIWRSWIWI